MEEQLKKEMSDLRAEFDLLKASSTIPLEIDRAFRDRLKSILSLPDGFASVPLAAITAPTGGATIDSQARTAINSIITTLENLGLVTPN